MSNLFLFSASQNRPETLTTPVGASYSSMQISRTPEGITTTLLTQITSPTANADCDQFVRPENLTIPVGASYSSMQISRTPEGITTVTQNTSPVISSFELGIMPSKPKAIAVTAGDSSFASLQDIQTPSGVNPLTLTQLFPLFGYLDFTELDATLDIPTAASTTISACAPSCSVVLHPSELVETADIPTAASASTTISACTSLPVPTSSEYATLSSASELVATLDIPAVTKRRPGRPRNCDSPANAIAPTRRLTRLSSQLSALSTIAPATTARGKKRPIDKNKDDIEIEDLDLPIAKRGRGRPRKPGKAIQFNPIKSFAEKRKEQQNLGWLHVLALGNVHPFHPC